MEITKMLTLSTAHITDSTMEQLDREPVYNNLGLCVYKKSDYGWFIYLDNTMDLTDMRLPNDLLKCLALAKSVGCDVLCLDCDGPEELFLPSVN